MAKAGDILGMNARFQLYTAQNSSRAKRYGFSKLRAKTFLRKHGINVPELYAQIRTPEELREFAWDELQGSFAIKPANGSAGKGIMVIKKRLKNGRYLSVDGEEHSAEDLTIHVSDILAGAFSTWGTKHIALIEERVPIHPDLEPYCQLGTPDVRIILYHKIPVMAMTRLPTETSSGRANLDQGALGLGIDMGTGTTTYGVSGKKKPITHFPHNHQPVKGITIPFWHEALKTAVRIANATGLNYMGADIFLHPERGPLVAEVNAYPGLSIQLANHAGLRKRLRRLEGIEARNTTHAVKLGQSLFAENYTTPLGDADRSILNPREMVVVYDEDDNTVSAAAIMNTARSRSAISEILARALNLPIPSHLATSADDDESEKHAPMVQVKFKLRDRIITAPMIVSSKLNKKRHQLELGRQELRGFLVSTENV